MEFYDQRLKLAHELRMHLQKGDGRFHWLHAFPLWPQKYFWDFMGLTHIKPFLTTDYLGTVLPAIPAKYGRNKKLELMVSTNTDIFREGIPDAPLQGLTIGKDGVCNFNINLHADLRRTVIERTWQQRNFDGWRWLHVTDHKDMYPKMHSSLGFTRSIRMAYIPLQFDVEMPNPI